MSEVVNVSNGQVKQATVLAAATRGSGATNSSDQLVNGAKGVRLFLNITAKTGTSPTLDVKVQVKNQLTGTYVDLAGGAFAQQNNVAHVMLTVYPGIAETANVSVSDLISPIWRVVGTVGGTATPTFTYTVQAEYFS